MRIFRYVVLAWLTLGVSPVQGQESSSPVVHTVVEGETLGTLARLYGHTPETLRELTGGGPPEPGRTLSIPPSPHGWARHTVLHGQDLDSIARGYGIPLHQLKEANPNVGDPLAPSQILVLPRRHKPTWSEPARYRQRSITASRAGHRRPAPHSGEWIQVTLGDGRTAWTRQDALVFHIPRSQAPAPSTSSTLSFGLRLSDEQKAGVHKVVELLEADGFRVKPDDVVNFMAVETGGTFSPSIRSKVSGTVGLAQFSDIAIADMNRRRPAHDQLTKDRLAAMTFTEQSEVVAEYLSTALGRKKMQGKDVTAADLYAAIFAPRAIGLPMEATVYSAAEDGGAYHRNRSLDTDGDGRISKTEMVQRLLEWARRGEAQRG